MRRADALIVGGGPAGSAAAIALARGGATPLLIERHAEPQDALCGGFLSWRTLATLERLGLDTDALGGERITRLKLFAATRSATTPLPRPALGVSRLRLDAALLDRAKGEGARIERGVAARAAKGGGVRLADGGEIRSDALFLATGKHDLRGLARPKGAGGSSAAMGLRFRFTASERLRRLLARTIELHLFRGGYAGLLLQEDGSANLCMALRRSRLGEEERDPARLLDALFDEAPALGERLAGERRAGDADAIGLVPYGWRARETDGGVFRLGDQAGVIASLAGEGVGLALASGEAASARFLAEGPGGAEGFQRSFNARARRPIVIAQRIKTLAERPVLAKIAVSLARAAPWALGPLARLTRIDDVTR